MSVLLMRPQEEVDLTLPVPVIPGAHLLITRTVSERRFLLVPDPLVNRVLRYCMAVAAERTGVRLVAAVFMSNHWHMVVEDPCASYPEFVGWFDSMVARCLNRHRDRSENLWSSDRVHVTILADADAVLRKIVYTLCNPAAANLVDRNGDWPGVLSSPQQLFGGSEVVTKPPIYFSSAGAAPPMATLRWELPAYLSGTSSVEKLRQAMADAIRQREADLRERRKKQGKTVLGREKVLSTDPFSAPRKPRPDTRFKPRVATLNPALLYLVLRWLRRFVGEYRLARLHYIGGHREVEFPFGTFWLRVFARLHCARSP